MKKPAAQQRGRYDRLRDGCRTLGQVTALTVRGDMARLTVKVPKWPGAMAGQFALLQAESSRCYLGRALSISDQQGERVSFVVAPVGEGTKELCSLKKGGLVWILGPMGNGYDVEALTDGPVRVVIVGGGVGLAPFPLLLGELGRLQASRTGSSAAEAGLSHKLSSTWGDLEVVLLMGFRNEEQAQGVEWLREAVSRSRLESLGLRVSMETSTEDGSVGLEGKVTDLVRKHLRPADRLAVCGPAAMAREIWRLCASTDDVKAWFSVEANMACGVGSCHGCTVSLSDGSYARVCREGPVFPGQVVFGG